MTSPNISRRAVARGAAWSIPAMTAAAAAPAIAASTRCGSPTISASGGIVYNYGLIGAARTDQQLTLGAQVTIAGLPAGVTVTAIREQFFVQNRQGQTSPGPGAFFMGNTSTNWNKAGACTNVGCSVNWTGKVGLINNSVDNSTAPGTGWSSKVTNTQNLASHTFSNGTVAPAWDVNLTWSPTSSAAYSSQTTNAAGCTTVVTTPSGRFGVNYYGITGATLGSGTCITADYIITATLSNGQTLTTLGPTAQFCP